MSVSNKQKNEVISFLIIGIINTIVWYALYVIFIFIGSHYFYAILFATIIGIVFSFKTMGTFVFKKKDNFLIIKFFIAYGIIFICNVLFVKFFIFLIIDKYVAGLLSIFLCTIISFLLNKFYVFKSNLEVKK